MKLCNGCDKERDDFAKDISKSDGLRTLCKDCTKDRVKPEWRRRSFYKKKYSITPEQYDQMVVDQGGVCAVCARPPTVSLWGHKPTLVIDHDHVTGSVRALLCSDCNKFLGVLGDDPERIRKLADYVEKFNGLRIQIPHLSHNLPRVSIEKEPEPFDSGS